MTNLHVPTIYLTAMARQHPGCWQEVDDFRARRGKDLPDWPHWCFLPLAAAYAILSEGRQLTPERAGQIAAFGALAAWRVTQGIYEVHPAVRSAIESTPLEGSLPSSVLFRMPEWCVYIRTPGLKYLGADAAGFFAYLEHDVTTSRPELRLVVDAPPHLYGQVPIHLNHDTLEQGIAAALTEVTRQLRRVYGPNTPLALPSTEPDTLAQLITPLVNLVLYVCAANAEISDPTGRQDHPHNPTPVKTKKGLRLHPPDHPTTWDVGSRIGAALAAAAAAGAASGQDGSHASPRPHIRRAHWHHFWTGPRNNQTASLRWLPPIPVNVDDEHPVVPTVRPVE